MGLFKLLGYAKYAKYFQYLTFIERLHTTFTTYLHDLDLLAKELASILFDVVDLLTAGLAARVVDKARLTETVRLVVAVFEDIFDGEGTAQQERLTPKQQEMARLLAARRHN